MNTRRSNIEYWLPKIAAALVIIATLVWGVKSEVEHSIEKRCGEAEAVIESLARCDAHEDCTPTRLDMAEVIDSEDYIARKCEDEAA